MQKNYLGFIASGLMDLDVAFHAFLVNTINKMKVFLCVHFRYAVFHVYTEYLIMGFFFPNRPVFPD